MSSSSEIQLTEASNVSASRHDDSDSAGDTEHLPVSGSNQTEDDCNISSLSEVQAVMEVGADVTASSEDKPTADKETAESISECKTTDDGKQVTHDKADSDISEQCGQMVSTKSRGGRSYQESRRSKKTTGEKSKSVFKGEITSEVVDLHDFEAGCLEQKGKGDVRDAEMSEENSVRHMKDLVCHPTCDGDPPALVSVIIDEHDMRKRYVPVIMDNILQLLFAFATLGFSKNIIFIGLITVKSVYILFTIIVTSSNC